MIAFTIWGWPIYRYGLFYLVTFISGYLILWRLGKRNFFVTYPNVHHFLTKGLDDLMLVGIGGVMLGGRLGHVFLYEWYYYAQHRDEILMIREGGMSFIGGVIGVTLGLGRLMRRRKMSVNDLLLLGDIILCIVPIGITLGRIGNYLNQELRWKPLSELSESVQKLLTSIGATRVYDQVDSVERVNTNLLQSAGEGVVTFIIGWMIMLGRYIQWRIQPGLISWLFLIWYAIVRFLAEELKELPENELWGMLSVSQWIMVIFFLSGLFLVRRAFYRTNNL